ncbi:MAG: DUF262 domain-containing protein [Selenomonadaceae bacterium]|nr:DUF262 domain-containing protein [Selenomonadaceae bacterium]
MPSIKAVADVPIFNFFNSTQKPFLIPEYQRPYSWGKDQALELFEDLKDFSANSNPSDTYFLGSIVFYTNQNQRREIVGGQQRIVTLFLLFHAIHEHLQSNSPLEMNLRGIIWEMNLMGDIIAPDKVRISSEATSDLANQKFIDILSNKAGNGDDNYSANYRLFQNQLRGFVKNQNAFLKFVNDLLNSTHILVIQANDFQSTLELFERINDRGLQLSDTDIFKADIYSKLDDSTRKEFINRWQNHRRCRIDDDALHVLSFIHSGEEWKIKSARKYATIPQKLSWISGDDE